MDKQYWRRQRPAAELAPWVSDIIGYAENGIRLTGAIETASLVVPLVISFGAPFAIALGRPPAPTERFGSFTSGLFAGHVVIDSTGASACVQVNFTPFGAFRFFGVPVGELCGRMVPLEDMSDAGLGELRRRLEDTADWNLRLQLAEAFIAARLRRAPAEHPATAAAFRTLCAGYGEVPVATVAARVGWSRKQLAQRFRDEVGLPPKAVARILRFNRLLALAGSGEANGWADLAAACGYADQPHLSREFAALGGITPARWLAGAQAGGG
jgi:AraC-like DNA-binding protein